MHTTPGPLQPPATNVFNPVTSRRSTLAIRVPTLTPAGESLPGGHTYLMLPPTVNLRHLLHEKVAAEHRRARIAGPSQSTLDLLLDGENMQWLSDELVIAAADRAFLAGAFTVLVDGQLVTDLDALIAITRHTSIAFIVAAPVLA
jgi:hypothetical protein